MSRKRRHRKEALRRAAKRAAAQRKPFPGWLDREGVWHRGWPPAPGRFEAKKGKRPRYMANDDVVAYRT